MERLKLEVSLADTIVRYKQHLTPQGWSRSPGRYDLNQIPYDYIVEVRNRFKGLDLIDRVPDE